MNSNKKMNNVSLPKINLPKGGSAVTGVDDNFHADAFTGAFSLDIPLDFPQSRGISPQISIGYSSSTGNGLLGVGFGFLQSSICIKTSRALPKYDETDVFLWNDSVELVLKTGEKYERENAQYLERHQQAFVLIEKVTGLDGVYWKITHNDNSVQYFGEKECSRIYNPLKPNNIFRWLVSREIDSKGNEVIYDYENWGTGNNKYLTRVRYGNYHLEETLHFAYSILLDYGQMRFDETDNRIVFDRNVCEKPMPRTDTLSDYRAGFLVKTEYVIKNIFIQHNFVSDEKTGTDLYVKRTAFIYDDKINDANCCCRLKKVIHSGLKGTPNPNCYTVKSLPAMEFEFSVFPNERDITFQLITDQNNRSVIEGIDLVDLEREGIPGILYRNAETIYYCKCIGDGKFEMFSRSLSVPTQFSNPALPMNIVSLEGNGLLEIDWNISYYSGYFPQVGDNQWGEFSPFVYQAINDLEYRTERVGLSGNNRNDALVITPEVIYFIPSLGLNGMGAAQLIPNKSKVESFNFEDISPFIFYGFAEVFGDGLMHRVKLEDKRISVWPNTGYGTFAKCISFDIPDLLIEERQIDLRQRLMFVDINGNGCSDVVLINSDGIEVYFNLLGSRFSKKHFFPFGNDLRFSNFDNIQFGDVKGDGRTCLILSKRTPHTFQDHYFEVAHYYCEIGYKIDKKVNKAYLLESVDGNMGSTTKVCYKSSLRDYLHDASIGKPWAIRLSTHVQVIDTITSYDHVSNTSYTSSYRYKNGYYNPTEHTFAGFGYVEHSDLADISHDINSPPPLLTRQWFHLGIPVTESIYKEFFTNDPDAPMPTFDLQNLLGEEALYTLTGTMLRQEVYEDTADGKKCPYEVSYTQHEIVETQKKHYDVVSNVLHRGVYRQYQQEAIHIDYEKRVNDPIVHQQVTLNIDEFNQVLRSCEVVYPRRKPLITEQALLICTADEVKLRNQAEKDLPRYIGIDIESKSYEISLSQKPAIGLYYAHNELITNVNIALNNPLPYQTKLPVHETSARVIMWGKQHYWNKDESDILSAHDVIPHVLLPHHNRLIAFDEMQLQQLGEGRISQEHCRNAGYEWCDENQYWWVHSAVSHYYGKEKFYLLKQLSYDWVDKSSHLFTQASVEYDVYMMFAVSSFSYLTDRIYLQNIARIDYRTLSPWQIIDENGNRSEVLTDELGIVIANSVYEKQGNEQGDLPLTKYHEQPVNDLEEVVNNPLKYLQYAGAFFHYQFAYKDDEKWHPACAVSLMRTKYKPDELKEIQQAVVYYDGFGRTVESRSYAGNDKWLVSGRVQYNAKGDVARSWLGFFANDWKYMDEKMWLKEKQEQLPPPSTFIYDALGRSVRTFTPKGFVTATQILNAWESRHYDESDTVLESPYYQSKVWDIIPEEKDAIEKAIAFYNTPQTLVCDALGRQILAVSSNKMNNERKIDWEKERLTIEEIDTCDPDLLVQWQCFDIQGRVLLQADARLNENNQGNTEKHYNFEFSYPISAGLERMRSADAGANCGLVDVHGNTVLNWDAVGNKHTYTYDRLQRPLQHMVSMANNNHSTTLEVSIYGEYAANADAKNLMGKLLLKYDSAGKHLTPQYNFDGTVPQSIMSFCTLFTAEMNWDQGAILNDEAHIEDEIFATLSQYDATGRIIRQTLPDGSTTKWEYGHMGNCVHSEITVHGQTQVIVKNSEVNANGQLVNYHYGNGTCTKHSYDDRTLDLTQIYASAGSADLQKLDYWHDPTGLITTMNNQVATKVFHNNRIVNPTHSYSFDALYRLQQSSGRVQLHNGINNNSKGDMANGPVKKYAAGNMQAIGNYTEKYRYDKGNNLLQQQRNGDMTFTRSYVIAGNNNRVTQFVQGKGFGKKIQTINYNDAGYMLNSQGMGSQELRWNSLGNIAAVALVLRQNGINDTEYYVYSGGIRLRKIALRYDATGKELSREDKIYLGPYTRRTFTGVATRHSITIGGVQKHDCVLQYSTIGKGQPLIDKAARQPELLYRYQHGNHLGSVGMESNAQAEIITYEEYNPFGDTVYTLKSEYENSKEYQYSAQEKDNSTQLYYYGYRYYAPWLCRWTRPDPAGTIDGFNLYAFVGNEPVGRVDMIGLGKAKPMSIRDNNKLKKEAAKKASNAKQVWIKNVKNIRKIKIGIWNTQGNSKRAIKTFSNESRFPDVILVQEASPIHIVDHNKKYAKKAPLQNFQLPIKRKIHGYTGDKVKDVKLNISHHTTGSKDTMIISESKLENTFTVNLGQSNDSFRQAHCATIQGNHIVNLHLPSGNPKLAKSKLKDLIPNVVHKSEPVIVAGDFNMDAADVQDVLEDASKKWAITYFRPEERTQKSGGRLDHAFLLLPKSNSKEGKLNIEKLKVTSKKTDHHYLEFSSAVN